MAAPAPLADATRDETSLRRFLNGLPGVDQVGVEQRAAGLATRSIKKGSKLFGLKLAASMVDLTTLEGKDTPGKVESLCRKALSPHDDPEIPTVAAVCVYPSMVKYARKALGEEIADIRSGAPLRRVVPRRHFGPRRDQRLYSSMV